MTEVKQYVNDEQVNSPKSDTQTVFIKIGNTIWNIRCKIIFSVKQSKSFQLKLCYPFMKISK